jgi:hypothetical protein
MSEALWRSLHGRVFLFLFFCNLDPHPHFLVNKKMIQRYFNDIAETSQKCSSQCLQALFSDGMEVNKFIFICMKHYIEKRIDVHGDVYRAEKQAEWTFENWNKPLAC